MSHRLIVLPDDTADAILAPINAARYTMNIRMFLFTDPSLINAVIAAKRRDVKVRVMLNPARRDGTSDNDAAREMLEEAGIAVRDSSAEFAVTHQKSMVIDDKVGFIESLNWETRDLTETRDYAVETTSKTEVAEMVRCFNADWDGQPFEPAAESELIWCPNNGRREGDALASERAVSGHGDHRAVSARGQSWRSRPHHGARVAQAQEEETVRGRERTAHCA
jgi:phosphatidylserine/phosphatidylglycerophosphate/cardiolipin synthase-like enzyme